MSDILPTIRIVILDCVVDDDVDLKRVVTVFTNDDCEGVWLMRCRETRQQRNDEEQDEQSTAHDRPYPLGDK